ncbi:carboxymuconolactone decarboxylase family protein [Sinorhizobium garamanticum]|uniref:Carboxymuconolactone decarboxylase family protein n=1 Tax=Sinorhizobium garamanticum TaxID=680247 RepID=A0ABY8DNR9_9HYPH|nr:carboxymuconolactone decarboxylase family protein [Sinorhizobium garamanticum]WEX90581.1 carboxymuconolactone decarboxylase family protein [Sinorhizobium garamanticum]
MLKTSVGLVTAAALGNSAAAQPTGAPGGDRRARGLEALGAVGGADFSRTLDPLSPDLSRLLIEDAYGDVMARPGLSQKNRELINVAVITVLGTARPALRFHIAGMLETGWSPREIVETLLHSVVYGGFPFAQDAMLVAREVFAERGVTVGTDSGRPDGDDWALGVQQLLKTGGDDAGTFARRVIDGSGPSPDLDRLTVEFAHGEIWNRPGLALKDRELATLAMVIAIGNPDSSVRFHVEACLRTGWTRAEITELLIQMPVYIGWPQALTAVEPSLAAFAEAERPGGLAAPSSSGEAIATQRAQTETDDVRFNRGVTAMGEISQASGEAVVNAFHDIAPDLGRYILEFSYGDVFSRSGLDLKSRELATVAALTARGTKADETPLKVHVAGALNTGATKQEVTEAILHMLPYAGFSRVQSAMAAASEVFSEQ